MKKILKDFTVFLLRIPVRILLIRKKPEVIAITGSAGKTTTKEFLRELLGVEFSVFAPAEGYNTEIGAPLGLFSEERPTKLFSPLRWFIIVVRIYFKALFMSDFAEKVVIEMGADKPGDIKYLCKVFKPQKGIILTVLPVHLAEFETIEKVAKEKAELAKALPKTGTLFLNRDDRLVREMSDQTKAEVVFFGVSEGDGYVAEKVRADITGLSFILKYYSRKLAISANIYGKHMIYPLLASISVATKEGIPANKVAAKVKTLKPFKGRMNILEGIEGSIIIDDSYNANPKSMVSALEFLGEQKGRRIALLGTMNELGSYEKEGHEMVGRAAAKNSDLIFTVGKPAEEYLVAGALDEGFKKDKIKSFQNSKDAGEQLKKIIREGDIVLSKGSQNNVRMENATEVILAEPRQAREVLVRQGDFWK